MVGGRARDPLAKMSRARAVGHDEPRHALPPTDGLTPGDRREDVVLQDLTPEGTATVLSVWIVRHAEDFPRLTTCYIV